jgi:hypothetical protein
MANLLADLAAALADGGIDPIPHGWYTARDMAASAGKSVPWAQKLLQRGIAEGLVEIRPFRIRNAGRVSAIPHYRVIA